jgi:membrane protease subunit (stomatin/prohibitin family)
MARLKAAPKNFAEAVEVLQDRISMRLGNNTYLEVTDADPLHGFIGVRSHSTYVVKFWADGQITLHTGGYPTVTTKERINQFIKGRVYQKAHEWYYVRNRSELGIDWGSPVEFTEGMNVA